MSFQENKEENQEENQEEKKQKLNPESEQDLNMSSDDLKKEEDSKKDDGQFSEFNDSEANIPTEPADEPNASHTDADRVATLETELAAINTKFLDTHNKMLRIAADADNTRKRLEKEKIDTRMYAIQEFARDLLPVIDSFEKALQTIEDSNEPKENANTTEQSNKQLASVTEGVKLMSKIFHEAIKKHGIERLPGKGAPFNPHYHNAIAKVVDSAYTSETVIEEFMPGYKIGDRILRTGLVKVAAPD